MLIMKLTMKINDYHESFDSCANNDAAGAKLTVMNFATAFKEENTKVVDYDMN